ncbi:MAG: lacto-N-biose phosphorylase central domain-containing protein, partial [Carnobacterium sp.]
AAVEVVFISFDDVISNGVDKDIDVIINAGDEGTAFSGGKEWMNEKLITTIRQWIYEGGGFVGIGEPSAYQHEGHYFQLATALGVDKELGFSLSTDKYFTSALSEHFISANTVTFDFGETIKNVYALSEATEIIEYSDGEVHLSSNDFGKGRAVYMAGLPYSQVNTRLLMRALFYAANKEKDFYKWHA